MPADSIEQIVLAPDATATFQSSNAKINRLPKIKMPKIVNKKSVFITLGILLLLVIVGAILIILPLQATIAAAKETSAEAQQLYAKAKLQDLPGVEEEIAKTQEKLAKTKKAYAGLSWLSYFPFVGSYINDGNHFFTAGEHGLQAADILTKAALPYVDLLGLKGQGTFAGGTTEDRIVKIVETLGKVSPEMDKVAAQLDLVKKEIDQVDPNRYPESFQGKSIRPRLVQAREALDAADSFLTQAQPMVKKLPQLLGSDKEAKYMVLFQNDGELRPTGGFITAYAVFRIEKGKITLNTSDDIYKLDDTITKHVNPPDPIATYLRVYGWRLRDSNFSPDFASSMKTFEDLYVSSPQKQDIAGIIAVDTHVLLKMLDVVGPINIYGTTFTTKTVPQCNCPMVIYELEKYADEPKQYERGSRKDIIGQLLAEMMKKTLSAPKQLLGNLVPVMMTEANTKHILFYLHDPDAQSGVEALDLAGRIRPTETGKDYLHINDANLGGAKSNLYIKQKVDLTVTTEANKTTNNLQIQYQHPQVADNCSLERKEGLCLSGIYRDYLRIYLPKGSTITSTRGFENKSTTFEDLGHTVVDGFFTVTPLGLAKIQIQYTTPTVTGKSYDLVVQKQPGTPDVPYKVTVNGQQKSITLTGDNELTF